MPQALPPSLAALLARDDFVDAVFEGGRCAHSVGEAPGTIFELVLDRLLAALDGESTVSPSGGYGFPARAASYHQGLDFQLGRVNEKGGWDRFDPVQKSKFHGALTSMAWPRVHPTHWLISTQVRPLEVSVREPAEQRDGPARARGRLLADHSPRRVAHPLRLRGGRRAPARDGRAGPSQHLRHAAGRALRAAARGPPRRLCLAGLGGQDVARARGERAAAARAAARK